MLITYFFITKRSLLPQIEHYMAAFGSQLTAIVALKIFFRPRVPRKYPRILLRPSNFQNLSPTSLKIFHFFITFILKHRDVASFELISSIDSIIFAMSGRFPTNKRKHRQKTLDSFNFKYSR